MVSCQAMTQKKCPDEDPPECSNSSGMSRSGCDTSSSGTRTVATESPSSERDGMSTGVCAVNGGVAIAEKVHVEV
ncbi:hypothetical protein C8Q74DRAFT_354006 [Fomes fomentarius]|nr:hypothetical protein C8Q74DRAFT_354006 [Fomes fomentarius]